MLSRELNNLAKTIEDRSRLKAGLPIDLDAVAIQLRIIATGVDCLEAITVPDHARIVPSEVRRKVLGENILAFDMVGGAS